MFQKVIKFSIYGLVFLMPLFWLPFSFEAFEFNKGYLLFFLVSIGMLAWLGKMIFQDKEIRFRRGPLDLYVLGFLGVMIFSALLSQNRIASLLGFYGRFWPSLIGILSLGGFYFLLTNNVTVKSKIQNPNDKTNPKSQIQNIAPNGLLKTFLWSSFFVLLIAFLSISGILSKLAVSSKLTLLRGMSSRTFNSTAGSLEALAVFLAFLTILVLGLLAFKKKDKPLNLYFLLFASLFLLALIDFWASWVIIFISLIFFLTLAFWKRIFKEDINRLSLPVLFLLISLIFILFNPLQTLLPSTSNVGNLPSEILLAQKTSWGVGWQGLKEHPVLGGGLGNFSYAFAKFKPLSFVQGEFWQIRFDRAGNHIAEILGSRGTLGILSYFLMIGMFLLMSMVIIGNKKDNSFSFAPLLLAFIALLIGQFVFYQNTLLAFIFWLFLAMVVISWCRVSKEKTYSFKDFPEVW